MSALPSLKPYAFFNIFSKPNRPQCFTHFQGAWITRRINTKQHLTQVYMQQRKARQRIFKRQRLDMPGLEKWLLPKNFLELRIFNISFVFTRFSKARLILSTKQRQVFFVSRLKDRRLSRSSRTSNNHQCVGIRPKAMLTFVRPKKELVSKPPKVLNSPKYPRPVRQSEITQP